MTVKQFSDSINLPDSKASIISSIAFDMEYLGLKPVFNNLDADYDYWNFTGDNVSWTDPKVDVDEINEKIAEMKS